MMVAKYQKFIGLEPENTWVKKRMKLEQNFIIKSCQFVAEV